VVHAPSTQLARRLSTVAHTTLSLQVTSLTTRHTDGFHFCRCTSRMADVSFGFRVENQELHHGKP
jgi:hypothetical protein